LEELEDVKSEPRSEPVSPIYRPFSPECAILEENLGEPAEKRRRGTDRDPGQGVMVHVDINNVSDLLVDSTINTDSRASSIITEFLDSPASPATNNADTATRQDHAKQPDNHQQDKSSGAAQTQSNINDEFQEVSFLPFSHEQGPAPLSSGHSTATSQRGLSLLAGEASTTQSPTPGTSSSQPRPAGRAARVSQMEVNRALDMEIHVNRSTDIDVTRAEEMEVSNAVENEIGVGGVDNKEEDIMDIAKNILAKARVDNTPPDARGDNTPTDARGDNTPTDARGEPEKNPLGNRPQIECKASEVENIEDEAAVNCSQTSQFHKIQQKNKISSERQTSSVP
jgi:hypothetical protein